MIKKYRILFKDVQIGLLTVTENSYVYVPNKVVIDKVEKRGDRILNLLTETITADTIPFFETRISNAKRFSGVSIGYHTDSYELVEESYS